MPHEERIGSGVAPGGLVFRVSSFDGSVLAEERVTVANAGRVEEIAGRHGDLAAAHARPGRPTFTHIYDGDSGECVKTVVVGGEG